MQGKKEDAVSIAENIVENKKLPSIWGFVLLEIWGFEPQAY